jgi:transposase
VAFPPDGSEDSRFESEAKMRKGVRRNHTPAFKTKWLWRGEGRRDLGRAGGAFRRPPHQIAQRKGRLLEGPANVLGKDRSEAKEVGVDLKALHSKIGKLTLESDFWNARSP